MNLKQQFQQFIDETDSKARIVEPTADQIRERRERQNAMNRAMMDDTIKAAQEHLTRYNWRRI